jgi:hypothetical protein
MMADLPAGGQPTVRVNHPVRPLGLAADGALARPADATAPTRCLAMLELLSGTQAGPQCGRVEGGQECLGDRAAAAGDSGDNGRS